MGLKRCPAPSRWANCAAGLRLCAPLPPPRPPVRRTGALCAERPGVCALYWAPGQAGRAGGKPRLRRGARHLGKKRKKKPRGKTAAAAQGKRAPGRGRDLDYPAGPAF